MPGFEMSIPEMTGESIYIQMYTTHLVSIVAY